MSGSDIVTGLRAHWTFDETSGNTVTDSSGNGNTGTLLNMGLSNHVEGKIGNGLDFTSNGTYVTVPHSISLDITTTELTVSAWVKFDGFGGCGNNNDDPAIIEKEGGFFMLGVAGGCNDEPRFRITTSNGTNTVHGSPLGTGVWYQLVGVYNGTSLALYQKTLWWVAPPMAAPRLCRWTTSTSATGRNTIP